jgi:hypothetical protein
MDMYYFESFGLELDKPKIEGLIPSYKLGDEFVKLRCTVVCGDYRLYPIYLGDMPNTDEWTDEDVMNFATKELEKFRVK